MESQSERVGREDLVLFINAAFCRTRQHEFYTDAGGQALTIEFLHQYTLGNHRRLYARCLSAGINQLNQGLVLFNLLASAHGSRAAGPSVGPDQPGHPFPRCPGFEVIVIISDGYENDPPGAVGEVARIFRTRFDPDRRVTIIHANPVFDSDSFAPRTLGAATELTARRNAIGAMARSWRTHLPLLRCSWS